MFTPINIEGKTILALKTACFLEVKWLKYRVIDKKLLDFLAVSKLFCNFALRKL